MSLCSLLGKQEDVDFFFKNEDYAIGFRKNKKIYFRYYVEIYLDNRIDNKGRLLGTHEQEIVLRLIIKHLSVIIVNITTLLIL